MMKKKKGIIFRRLNFILVLKKYELFENLIFLDKLEQAICEILIKITVVSQPKIQNRDTQRRFPPKCTENTF